MLTTSDPRDPTERTPWPWPRRPRPSPPGKRRPAFRPELEPVEDRFLLSSYTVTDVTFPGYQAIAWTINNSGQTLVESHDPSSPGPSIAGTYYLRQPDGSLISLPGEYAGGLTNPAPDGSVTVVGADSNQNLFLWNSSAGLLPGVSLPGPVSLSEAGSPKRLSISDSGMVVGGYLTPSGATHAFVWQNGKFQDLHSLLTTADPLGNSIATGVIDANSTVPHLQVVVDATVSGAGWNAAFVLTDTNNDGSFSSSETRTLASGGGETVARDINDVGQIVGDTGGNAVIWQSQTGAITKKLPTLKGKVLGAAAINHLGYVVGSVMTSPAYLVAALWAGSGSIQDLNSLIPSNSPLRLVNAWDINDTGQIVGAGFTPSGGHDGFLLTPTSSPTAAVTTSATILTDAKTLKQAPVPALAQSARPLTAAGPSFGLQGSLILIPLTPASDQDLTMLATELIHSGSKRPRALFGG